MNGPPQLTILAPDASPEETAAVAAALARFMRATARSHAPAEPAMSRWQQAALHEGVAREHLGLSPWS